MKPRILFSNLLLAALFLASAPPALASTTWYVDGVNGNDTNDCKSSTTACKTIGHAISLASSGDSIMVAAATYAENITISFSLKIVGAGAKTTIIDGGGNGNVVTIPFGGVHVTLVKVTIRNGTGGINNAGTLVINNSTISGNIGSGGGIVNAGTGTVTINNSTLSGNSAKSSRGGSGGGIQNDGNLTINNSTLSGNSAPILGGGILNQNVGNLTINNSTLVGNSVTARFGAHGGGIYNGGKLAINSSTISGNSAKYGCGGGISNGGMLAINSSTISGNIGGGCGGAGINNSSSGSASLQNSIVANNSFGNCVGTITSNGYNLSSDGTCNFTNTGDLNNTDPKLGPLQNNGGPTQTQALLSGSPAIDAGNPSGCTDGQGHLLKTDQRDQPRPDKEDTGGCDMGAYEGQSD